MNENDVYTVTEVKPSEDKKWVLVTIKEITKLSKNKRDIVETSGVIDRIEVEKLLADMNKQE